MLPFLEIEKTNLKSEAQHKTKGNASQNQESGDFFDFFNALTKSDNLKSHQKSIQPNTLSNAYSDKKANIVKETPTHFIKSLEEKYSLRDKQNNLLPNQNQKVNISLTKSEPNTLKNLIDVANSLDLKVSKVKLETKDNLALKSTPLDSMLTPKAKIIPTENSKNNILGNILQDKELLQNAKSPKTQDLKEKIQDIKDSKEIAKQAKTFENKENLQKTTLESKNQEVKIANAEKTLEEKATKGIKDSKDSKDSKNSTEVKGNKDKSIPKEISNDTFMSYKKEIEGKADSKYSTKEERYSKKSLVDNLKSENREIALEEAKTQRNQDFLDNLFKVEAQKPKTILETQEQKITGEKLKEKVADKNTQEVLNANIQSNFQRHFETRNTLIHFSDKLKDALQNYRPPITQLSLELNPENLGSVELTITKRGERVHLQIGSNVQALQLFMQNAQEFKTQLNNAGFQDITMDFKDTSGNSLAGGFGDSNPHQQQEQNQNNNPDKEKALHLYQQNEEQTSLATEVSELHLSFYYEA
ncbi:MAG: flagellar hook-length control protein FliK [Helicobacter sp.]|nr:flagellar hook-length control protein FliK [Helicobacter sp.]